MPFGLQWTFCERLQWRIQDFPEEGAPTLQAGEPTYDFAKFSQKLHEIERIWTPRGGARPKFYYVDPPLDWFKNFNKVFTCQNKNVAKLFQFSIEL